MNYFFNIKNVEINLDLKTKKAVFLKAFEIFKKNNAVSDKYLDAMIQRDKIASVGLGNYLILLHGTDDSQKYVKQNCVILLHLKKPIMWDDNLGQIVLAFALKKEFVMEFMQLAGIVFSNLNEVKKLLKKKKLTKLDFFNFVKNN